MPSLTWRAKLRRRSRDITLLWKIGVAILAIGLLLGMLIRMLAPRPPLTVESVFSPIHWIHLDSAQVAVPDRFRDDDVSLTLFMVALAHIDPDTPIFDAWVTAAVERTDDPDRVAAALIESLRNKTIDDSLAELAHRHPPAAHAHAALAALYLRANSYAAAGGEFEREAQRSNSDADRQFALQCYSRGRDGEALARLSEQPNYRSLMDAYDLLLIAEQNEDWRSIVWLSLVIIEHDFRGGFPTALAIIAGLGWLLLLLHMGQSYQPGGSAWWLCAIGVTLGGLSIWLTHVFIIYQELRWDLRRLPDLVGGLKFYILGVGLREELAKLILFLPLVPILVHRGRRLETLVVAASVGLGFAIVENMGYFGGSQGSDSIGRFLTANFLHMGLTGLIGLALVDALRPPHDVGHFALVFLIAVCAHGVYDAAMVLDDLDQIWFASPVIFILLSYAFFQELRAVSGRRDETIHLTATFVIVCATLWSLTFIYFSWVYDWTLALQIIGSGSLSMGTMFYMYLREMPDSLMH